LAGFCLQSIQLTIFFRVDADKSDGVPTHQASFMKRIFIFILFACLTTTHSFQGDESSSQSKMVPPVDSDKSMDRSTFQAEYDRVWQTLDELLVEYGFKFKIREKPLGKIETGFVIFSHNSHFSKISNGFKAFVIPPKGMMKKWEDGKIKIYAEVHRVSDESTQLMLRPEIYGFSSTFLDDSSISGEWRLCQSNGKLEFEMFNEIATRLQKKSMMENSGESGKEPTKEVSATASTTVAGETSTVLVDSAPEGAEILLNNQLVGMTPSRLILKPGKYQVILQKSRYKKYIRQFVVIQGSDLTISVELKEN
jgi:PEGA domain-containing protein